MRQMLAKLKGAQRNPRMKAGVLVTALSALVSDPRRTGNAEDVTGTVDARRSVDWTERPAKFPSTGADEGQQPAQTVSKRIFGALKLSHPIAEDEQDEAVRSRRQSYAKLSPPRSA